MSNVAKVALLVLLSGCASSSSKVKFWQAVEPKNFTQAVAATNCPNDGQVEAGIRYFKQETTLWCWAASAEMVSDYYNLRIPQCVTVNDYCDAENLSCKPLDCCAIPVPKECKTGGWPLLDAHAFEVEYVERYLTPKEVVTELACHHDPFMFSWKENGGSGHMMVAIGFITVKNKDYLVVHDPLKGDKGDSKHIPYAYYKTGSFLHWRDYYQIDKVE